MRLDELHDKVKTTGSPKIQHELGLLYEELADKYEDDGHLVGAEIWLSIALENGEPAEEDLRRVESKISKYTDILIKDMPKGEDEDEQTLPPKERPALSLGKKGNYRLTDREVAQIRYYSQERGMNQTELTKKFKTTRSTIGKIVRYESRQNIRATLSDKEDDIYMTIAETNEAIKKVKDTRRKLSDEAQQEIKDYCEKHGRGSMTKMAEKHGVGVSTISVIVNKGGE